MSTDEQPGENAPDRYLRESPFVLPPVEGAPFANSEERAQAIRRMLEQAERERGAAS